MNLLHFLKIFKHKINDHSCRKYSEIYLNLFGKIEVYPNLICKAKIYSNSLKKNPLEALMSCVTDTGLLYTLIIIINNTSEAIF